MLALAIALRLYRLDQLTTFGGDQGQDFLVVRDMVLYQKWTLLGIKTSVAPFFQGPLYLYILYPFFALLRLQPIAGAIAAVTLSAVTTVFLYITVRRFFSQNAALLSTLIFAASPQLVMYGNTPLYQNFLPLFLVASFYFFFATPNIITIFFLGFFAGLGMELHWLNISLALTFLTTLVLSKGSSIKNTLLFIAGIISAVIPTLLFEIRHQFLNTHLFWQYFQSQNAAERSVSILSTWIKGAAIFLGGDSLIVGKLILISTLFAFFITHTKKSTKLHQLVGTLFIILGIFSFKMSVLEPHYMLSLWVALLIALPVWLMQILPGKLGIGIVLLLIVFNLFSSASKLSQNHGYTMPDGWTLRKIQEAGALIASDAQKHPRFNVASLLDGETRAYALRYTTLLYGATPDRVEKYPEDNSVYVVARPDTQLHSIKTWEVNSLQPFNIAAQWDLGENVMLYRLDKIHSP